MWQSGARSRIYDIYGLVYWGILTRMEEVRQQARHTAEASGRTPTPLTGTRTKKMKQWRALGRLLLDIRMLVFNCGRSDFRSKHSAKVNLIAQSTLAVGSNAHAAMANDISRAMLDSTAALVAMLGIVRLLEQFLHTPQWVRGVDIGTGELRPVLFKNYTLWALARTLLAHSCWRQFPTLSVHLPEILLGGTFKGVPLQT